MEAPSSSYGGMTARRKVLIGLVCAASVIGAGTAAVAASQGGQSASETPSSQGSGRDYDRPVPAGKMPVVGNDGEVAGFIDIAAYDSGERFPTLELDGSPEVHGLEATDAQGSLVGYFVEEIGFVDLATATDPTALDAAFRSYREQNGKSQAEVDADLEQARAGRMPVEGG